MAWTIEFHPKAEKEFSKLSRDIQLAIRNYLRNRISLSDDPRLYGKPLRGELAGLWRYRVGKCRLICNIEDERLEILVVRVAKRDKVYD